MPTTQPFKLATCNPANMSSKVVEITLISCEGLTTGFLKRPLRKNARGVIRLPHSAAVLSTGLDEEGGAYPQWNAKFAVEMPPGAAWFDVEVREGVERVIGAARVPAADFGVAPDGYLNFLSYRLRERSGGFNGVVNVSVRVVRRKEEAANGSDFGSGSGSGCEYVVGVPSRVVIGVPVFSGTK